jgi:hypothetical protein
MLDRSLPDISTHNSEARFDYDATQRIQLLTELASTLEFYAQF